MEKPNRIIANELLPVYETDTGERVVDARELHGFLGVGRDFSNWIKGRVKKYGFVEGEDFTPILAKTPSGGRPSIEYILKLDIAKELCMVENNEQGRKARRYFIDIEKRYKAQAIDTSQLSPELQMFKQIWDGLAKKEIEDARRDQEIKQLQSGIATIKDTFLQRDDDWRKSINKMLNTAAKELGGNYRELRAESYRVLEERGRCDLSARLRNLRQRLEDGGATKTKIRNTNKMDCIEADPRLKEIYTTIVKELSIGTLKI